MKQQTNPRDPAAIEARRAALARQRGASTGMSGQMARVPPNEGRLMLQGWAIWLAWGVGLLALLTSGATGVLMATSLVTPLVVSAGMLTVILLLPVVGGVLALVALAFGLLATRQARKAGARVAAPVVLVGLATLLLVVALFFGGLVTLPRSALAAFAQTIQAHCARVAQVLAPYGSPPDSTDVLANAPAVLGALQQAASMLPEDQQVLSTLTAPDPTYQPLVENCRVLAQDDLRVISSLQQTLTKLPPDQTQVTKVITDYVTTTSQPLAEVQRLGEQLARAVFAPFEPPERGAQASYPHRPGVG